ncbi:tetratricopeptide repeat protein [Amycolatopsis sp. cmx-4-83]|uniref:tetratricopeptide repeat protein n=1 Tax=Amycolatopsis sp. cmx-4-83 TaxID=2790940 RepID=UPI00397A7305
MTDEDAPKQPDIESGAHRYSDNIALQVSSAPSNFYQHVHVTEERDSDSKADLARSAAKSLAGLVKQSAVVVADSVGQVRGTAFFIAPGLALTAAHVATGSRKLYAQDRHGVAHALVAVQFRPELVAPGITQYPLPDLAVLETDVNAFRDVPSVFLQEGKPNGSVVAYGYRSDGAPQELPFEYEGTERVAGIDLLRSADLPVPAGMSGAPVLDAAAGAVVAYLTTSPNDPRRARAVSIAEVRRLVQSAWSRSAMYHRSNPTWATARTGDFVGTDPVSASRVIAETVLREARSRDEALPDGIDAQELHQTIWLRRRSPVGHDPVAEPAFRQRWRAERVLSGLTVVIGDPGYGKSWLLAHQAAAVAERARTHLATVGSVDACILPIRLSCAALGAVTDDTPAGLAQVLISSVVQQVGGDRTDTKGLVVTVERAVTDGRVLVCADGLDEMPADALPGFRRNLLTLLAQGNAALIASRPAALHLLDGIAAHGRDDFELTGFSTRETVSFVRAWLRDQAAADALLGTLAEGADLTRLAEVPLLLSFFCQLANQVHSHQYRRTTLPQLYRDVALHLLSGMGRGSRTPSAPAAMPDALVRLELLADVLGELQDTWRGGVEDIPRSTLRRTLANHGAHADVAASAQVRARSFPAGAPELPDGAAEAILWEYLFDGILVESTPSGPRPTVKFLHPVMREVLLADYFSRLAPPDQLACVDRHRWFDPGWTRVIVGAATLVDDAAPLVDHLASGDGDPWMVQHTLAAQIIAEADDYTDQASTERVLSGLTDAARADSAFERRQAVAALGVLVRAACSPAHRWARQHLEQYPVATIAEQSQSDKAITIEVLCSLVETGDSEAVRETRTFLGAQTCTAATRARLLAGLTASGIPEHSYVVRDLLESGRARYGDLTAFLGAVRAHSAPAVAIADGLLRNHEVQTEARLLVGRALLECGSAGVNVVLEVAEDPSMGWAIRCRLHTELLRAAVPSVTEGALRLLTTQETQFADRADLTLALVEDGVVEAAPQAALLLTNDLVPWPLRRSLARALARQGKVGLDLLISQIQHPAIDLWLKMRHICALVEIGSKFGEAQAEKLHRDRGVPVSMRFTLTIALLEHKPALVDEESALELATAEQIGVHDRMLLAVHMVQEGIASGAHALRNLLHDAPSSERHWPTVAARLAEAGHGGRECLVKTAHDGRLPWWTRSEAVLNIGWAAGGRLTPVDDVVAEMPESWRDRVVLGLAIRGLAPDVPAFLELARRKPGGYRILHEFLQRAATDRPLVNKLLVLAQELQRTPWRSQEGLLSKIELNSELLRELGLEPHSDEETRMLLDEFYTELEREVGTAISRLMLHEQLDEFEEYIDSNDEESATAFLGDMIPEHRTIVFEKFDDLKARIRAGTFVLSSFGENRPHTPPLRVMARTCGILAEWISLAESGDWSRWLAFALRNREAIGNRAAWDLLAISARMDRRYRHEAALFAARRIAEKDSLPLLETFPALLDWLHGCLGDGNFEELFLGGCFSSVRFPREEAGWQMFAVGALQQGSSELAVTLMRTAGDLRPPAERDYEAVAIGRWRAKLGWTAEQEEELRSAYRQGSTDRPLSEYEKDAQNNPAHAVTHFNLGVMLQRAERHVDAIAAYRRAAELDHGEAKTLRAIAGALHANGQKEEALAEIRRSLEVNPNEPIAHSIHGIILHHLQDLDGALIAFARARQLSPSDLTHVNNEAIALCALQRFEESLPLFDQSAEIQPLSLRTTLNHVEALHRTGRFPESLEVLTRAIGIEPSDARMHSLLGFTHCRLGNYDEAARALLEAHRLDPANVTYTNNLGEALLMAGHDADALPHLRASAAGGADQVEASVLLAVAIHATDPAESTERLRHAIGRGHTGRLTTFRNAEMRAIALSMLGKQDDAVEVLRHAADERRPDDLLQRPLYERLKPIIGLDHAETLLHTAFPDL